MITWEQRRGQIKHLLYELCLTGRIDRATFCEQIADLNNVTPVVRCKDCKHHLYAIRSNEWGECDLGVFGRHFVEDEWYCSMAERKSEPPLFKATQETKRRMVNAFMGRKDEPAPEAAEILNDGTYSDGNLYECDPEKNTECRKTGCYINGGECRHTTHAEYAREDQE